MKVTVEDFIESHTHINYCEAIIHPDGLVEYAMPSHNEKLISVTRENRQVIHNKMPVTASPIKWLTEYTGCIPVWTQGYILPSKATDEQLLSLYRLISAKLVSGNVFI